MQCSWTSDTQFAVLEVQDSGGKSMVDTPRSTWRDLLHEFEDEGIVEYYVNGHDVEKVSSHEGLGSCL